MSYHPPETPSTHTPETAKVSNFQKVEWQNLLDESSPVRDRHIPASAGNPRDIKQSLTWLRHFDAAIVMALSKKTRKTVVFKGEQRDISFESLFETEPQNSNTDRRSARRPGTFNEASEIDWQSEQRQKVQPRAPTEESDAFNDNADDAPFTIHKMPKDKIPPKVLYYFTEAISNATPIIIDPLTKAPSAVEWLSHVAIPVGPDTEGRNRSYHSFSYTSLVFWSKYNDEITKAIDEVVREYAGFFSDHDARATFTAHINRIPLEDFHESFATLWAFVTNQFNTTDRNGYSVAYWIAHNDYFSNIYDLVGEGGI